MQTLNTPAAPLSKSEQTSRWPRFLPFVLLAAIAVLTYIRGIHHLFVAEDYFIVLNFRGSLGDMLQLASEATRLRPMYFIFQWVLGQFFGTNPVGYHCVILLLHVANTLLLYLVASLLSKDRRIGFVTALIYTLYPRSHQAVLWYAANQHLLMVFFALICVFAFEQHYRTRQTKWQILALVSLFLTLMSQEAGVVVLPLLFLLDVIVHRQGKYLQALRDIQLYRRYVPYVVVLIIFGVVTMGGPRLFKLTSPQSPAVTETTDVGFGSETYAAGAMNLDRVKTMAQDMMGYLTYAALPEIPLRTLNSDLTGLILAGSIILILAGLFIVGEALVKFAVLWIVLAVTPFVVFVPFGNADRYFYLPAIGFALLLSLLLWRLYDRLANHRLILARGVVFGLIAAYAISSIVLLQNRIDEWYTAGEIADHLAAEIRDRYPHPPADGLIVVANTPEVYRQVYVFSGGGLEAAIRLAYGEQEPDLRVLDVRAADVIDFLREAQPVEHPLPDTIILLYQDGSLIDKSDVVASIDQLTP